ncbi:MAG: CTP synthase [Patescibacteria group bacterium]
MRTKYIFVVGGVMSGVGKGVTSSSVANIMESRGFKVTSIKIDPYVNVDAGTMNPTEHGEVFVLDDGMECDQDMGNYERFLNKDIPGINYMTTGSIYQSIISKERALEYKGKCVSVVPDVPLEIIEKINNAVKKNKAEIVIIEIGGTVGEYQNILFLEAVRILKIKNHNDTLLILVSYLPHIGQDSEPKTKPTQHASRTLNSAGLQPDIIIARSTEAIDEKRKEKIAFNCNVRSEDIISAPNVESIYDIPLNFEKDSLSDILCKKLKIKPRKKDNKDWSRFTEKTKNTKGVVKIGIVGKYFSTGNFVLADSYISIIEAIKHASYANNKKPIIEWLDAGEMEVGNNLQKLFDYDGIIIPGGFGDRGVEGKIAVIKHCRENKIPILGICYGMQLMVVEFARNVGRLKGAHTTEVSPKTPYNIVDILPEQKEKLKQKDYGGSMRLGAYKAKVEKGTIAFDSYGREIISERHRHRYEVNYGFVKQLQEKGIIFSCKSPDGKLMEIAELPKNIHPFFLGAQFHPEFKSRPLDPHPLFLKFIETSIKDR